MNRENHAKRQIFKRFHRCGIACLYEFPSMLLANRAILSGTTTVMKSFMLIWPHRFFKKMSLSNRDISMQIIGELEKLLRILSDVEDKYS